MTISRTSRVRPNPSVLFQKLNDEAVLLHLESGVYFGLDYVGMDIWKLLPESESLGGVANVISTQYQVPHDQCESDLLELIRNMIQHGLVILADSDNRDLTI